MKNFKIALCLIITTITSIYAQENKKTNFLLGPETVEIYDFEASTESTKGTRFQYEFEDDYTVKLTNKVYKVNLVFDEAKNEPVQKLVTRILDGNDSALGYSKLVWKKTTQNGKLMYGITLKEGKLKIEVNRLHMNAEAYQVLNDLGKELIKEINH